MSIRRRAATRLITGTTVLALASAVTAAVPAGAVTAGGPGGRGQVAGRAVRPANSFIISNFHSGLCLGISGGRDHSPAVQWSCNGNPDQQWHLGSPNQSGSSFYQIINGDGQCLGIAGGSLANGADAVGWTCLGPSHEDQYWEITVDTSDPSACTGWETLFNGNSGHVLGVGANSTAVGASVVQWVDQHQCNNQRWTGAPTTIG